MQPGPGRGPVQCYIIRDRTTSRVYPQYSLFLDKGQHFLVAARKRKKSKSANYLMSLDGQVRPQQGAPQTILLFRPAPFPVQIQNDNT